MMKATMSYIALRMTGMCRNGAERDGGRIFHGVPASHGGGWENAICGARPGKRGNGWSFIVGEKVTCPRCLKKIARQGKQKFPGPAAKPRVPVSNKRARDIVASLERFANLPRQHTDEIGWIALRYSCSRAKAEKLIEQARAITEPPATVTLHDLAGLPGKTEAVPVRNVTGATEWLRKGRAVSVQGTEGTVKVWHAEGHWHCLFAHAQLRTVAALGCNHLAAVVEWLKEWLPRCHTPENQA